MKTFRIYLRDGRTATLHADLYLLEGNQYVFRNAANSETQFFIASDVSGICHAAPPQAPDAAPTDFLEQTERETVLRVLAEQKGHQTRAAIVLGISRRNLLYKLAEYSTAAESRSAPEKAQLWPSDMEMASTIIAQGTEVMAVSLEKLSAVLGRDVNLEGDVEQKQRTLAIALRDCRASLARHE